MTEILWVLSLVALATAIGLAVIVRRVPRLPLEWPPEAETPAVVLVKPVLADDPATLGRCRAWLESAARYPGWAGVVFTTLARCARPLEVLSLEQPEVAVRIIVCTPHQREKESGIDKANRLAAAEAAAIELLDAEDGIFLLSDEDVEPLDPNCVERLAASAARPGSASSLLYPIEDQPGKPWWRCVATTNMRLNNAVYAAGALALARQQGIVLGWTVALWASDLRKSGGFAATASSQSEDVALGRSLASNGITTRLFEGGDVIRVFEAADSLEAMWAQQVRWRSSLRGCHSLALIVMSLALPLVAPVLLAVAACATAPAPAAFAAGVAVVIGSAGAIQVPVRRLWTLPLHEFLAVGSQIAGMLAHRVLWGPFVYEVDRRGRVTRRRSQVSRRS